MTLKVAVQMDPIARINIRGDSTFALLLEAQKRGHTLSYYTPETLSLSGKGGTTRQTVSPAGLASLLETLRKERCG